MKDERGPNDSALEEAFARDSDPDRRSASELAPRLYEELRALARARLAREAPGQTLQPTALVHEAFLRVVGKEDPGWDGHGHFFAAVAEAMRRILVDQARRKVHRRRHQDEVAAGPEMLLEAPDDSVLDVHEALVRLEREDSRKARIVELRYFCGLTQEETARAMGLSLGTIEREWRFLRAWLTRELGADS